MNAGWGLYDQGFHEILGHSPSPAPPKLKSFCWNIWFIRFFMWKSAWNPPDFKIMSFCVMIKYRSFEKRKTKHFGIGIDGGGISNNLRAGVSCIWVMFIYTRWYLSNGNFILPRRGQLISYSLPHFESSCLVAVFVLDAFRSSLPSLLLSQLITGISITFFFVVLFRKNN